MANKKGLNTFGRYVVSINAMPFHIYTSNFLKMKGRTKIVFYIASKTQRPSDTVF